MKRAAAILLICAALPIFAGDKKVYSPSLVKKPPQTAEIADLKIPKPQQACPNWAWAAGLELMLEEQKVVDYKQEYWILKSAAGDLCIETAVDLDQLKQWIDGKYKLMDGSDVHFEATVTQGAPSDVSHFVQLLKDGRTALVLWKGRPCVLKALEYDEYIYPNGQRMLEARKLTLIDPLEKVPVMFEKGKDDAADIGGVLEVAVVSADH